MTAPACKDCAYVRYAAALDNATQVCGVGRIPRLLCSAQRAPNGPCGPDAKLFSARQGVE